MAFVKVVFAECTIPIDAYHYTQGVYFSSNADNQCISTGPIDVGVAKGAEIRRSSRRSCFAMISFATA